MTSTPTQTVRAATLAALRAQNLTTIFANPGSTEVPFLVDLPADFDFRLALHEGSVVGMACGWAIARQQPALVQLHTTAGLGNAVGALATARANRVPLVVLVGQQDRRHLASEPFLAGHLQGLAGQYPVRVDSPVRAQDVPAAVVRARHAAEHARGPALVIVPMDDWSQPFDAQEPFPAPHRLVRAAQLDGDDALLDEVTQALAQARSPGLVVGAGADTAQTWAALGDLAERTGCPVYQESFGARAGFPQDHPRFAGHLPAQRTQLRAMLAGHDTLLVFGAPALRQYIYSEGPLVSPGTRVLVVTEDAEEAYRAAAELALLAPLAEFARRLGQRVPPRSGPLPAENGRVEVPAPPAADEPLRPDHVFAALAQRLAPETILVEETPSSRPELQRLVAARRPLGFLSAAMGGLGFALPAATGLRMGDPHRPVVAVLGDGSALYQVQGLWSAVRYRVGTLFLVLSNGRYAVMDHLAGNAHPPWPDFTEVSVSALAQALGCPARTVTNSHELNDVLDATLSTLADRREPLLVEVTVSAENPFQP